jgi:hypothetical protein
LWPRTLAENPKLEKRIGGHARKVLGRAWRKATKLGGNLGKLGCRAPSRDAQSNGGIDAAQAASYAVGHHEALAAHVWRSAGEAWSGLERARRFWD